MPQLHLKSGYVVLFDANALALRSQFKDVTRKQHGCKQSIITHMAPQVTSGEVRQQGVIFN